MDWREQHSCRKTHGLPGNGVFHPEDSAGRREFAREAAAIEPIRRNPGSGHFTLPAGTRKMPPSTAGTDRRAIGDLPEEAASSGWRLDQSTALVPAALAGSWPGRIVSVSRSAGLFWRPLRASPETSPARKTGASQYGSG